MIMNTFDNVETNFEKNNYTFDVVYARSSNINFFKLAWNNRYN